jgi:hypothetical protein
MSHSITQIEKGSAQNPLRLGVLLASMACLGVVIVGVDSRSSLSLLGWSKAPGFILLAGLVILAVGLLRLGRPTGRVVAVVALFGASLFLDQIAQAAALVADIFPLPSAICLLLALSPPFVGVYLVYGMRVPLFMQGAFALLGGYIQAVHIYNAFHPTQHMGFFGGGWIS